jgi:FtsP/CotA-like multicopper oxidase with cupredoxin domain
MEQSSHSRDSAQRRVAKPQPVIGRRNLMKLAAGAGVASIGVAGRGLILPWFDFPRAAAAEELAQPEVRTSQNGGLDTTLTCRVKSVPFAGKTPIMAMYEDSVPAPTLRVRPGDTLRVNLVNTLDELPSGLPSDSPFLCSNAPGMGGMAMAPEGESVCDTNLHVHGLHVSPSGNSDNIFVRVPAGESFQYEYQIPSNHPSGLYWYHPHLHGTVTTQVFGGMAGAIIVEGEVDELPGISEVPERLLILQATQLYPDGSSVASILNFNPPTIAVQQKDYLRTVNGQLNPTLTMRPGETERWRILNASTNVTYLLHLDGHQLYQIGKDGNPLNETWARDMIHLSPGERIEVLVQAGEKGTYALRTHAIASGFTTQVDAALATLIVDGNAMTPQPLPKTLLPLEDLSTAKIDQHRRITFQFGTPINPPQTVFWIDHQIFDGNRDDQVVQLNATDEWVIRNASSTWHPFHIHINHYQVVAINGQPVPVRSNEDTTNVPPFGEITMRTRYLDFEGRWVYHCHILLHEDHGMMGTVRALA